MRFEGLENDYSDFILDSVVVMRIMNNLIGFTAQVRKEENSKFLDIRDTALFFFYPSEPQGKRWAFRYLSETAGTTLSTPLKPDPIWCAVSKDGAVYTMNSKTKGWKNNISDKKPVFFENVKTIQNGHAIAVGPNRNVFIRKDENKWEELSNGLDKDTEGGFSDIDGFSETDMYACGKNGDLWHYDGTIWEQIKLGTNTDIPKLCCASDGFVYAIMKNNQILKGRDDKWQFIEQDATEDIMEEIVCFNDKVIISTEKGLFEMKDNALVPADLNVPEMKAYNHIAAGDGILVVLGGNEAQMYDGKKWTQILEPPAEEVKIPMEDGMRSYRNKDITEKDIKPFLSKFTMPGIKEQVKEMIEDGFDCFDGDVVLCDKSITIDGKFNTENRDIALFIVNGDLTVNGPYLDACNDGPDIVLVLGNLYAQHVFTAGSLEVTGDMIVKEAIIGDYNDGSALIHGNIQAKLLLPADHSFKIKGNIEVPNLVGEKEFVVNQGITKKFVPFSSIDQYINPEFFEDGELMNCRDMCKLVVEGKSLLKND